MYILFSSTVGPLKKELARAKETATRLPPKQEIDMVSVCTYLCMWVCIAICTWYDRIDQWFERLVQMYNEIVWWFVLLYNGGLLCCIAGGLEVVDIFAHPLVNHTHI